MLVLKFGSVDSSVGGATVTVTLQQPSVRSSTQPCISDPDRWAAGGEDPGGAGHCLIHQLHDITSRHVAERRLQHIAYHDGLTDLANRNCFQERLGVAVEKSRTDRRYGFALIVLDLDRFKIVNDSLGHPAGDELLKEVARRLETCVRPVDLVARLGGDEFAALVDRGAGDRATLQLADRVLADWPVTAEAFRKAAA